MADLGFYKRSCYLGSRHLGDPATRFWFSLCVNFYLGEFLWSFFSQKAAFDFPNIIFLAVSFVLWNFVLVDYQKDRISTFLNPLEDPLGQGYNLRQSLVAVGSGSFWGRGLGLGTQSQLRFLPEIGTDFIFANIAETLGFLGAFIVLLFFFFLLAKILSLMRDCRDSFGLLLVYGVGSIYFIHIVFNIGMNIGLFPVAGLPLPFLSYGGSFLITCLIGAGIIESVSIRKKII